MAGRQFLLFVAAVSACSILMTRAQKNGPDSVIVPGIESDKNVFRLPEYIHPLHYKLRIVTHLDDEEGFKFTGKVWIKVSTKVFRHSPLKVVTPQRELLG